MYDRFVDTRGVTEFNMWICISKYSSTAYLLIKFFANYISHSSVKTNPHKVICREILMKGDVKTYKKSEFVMEVST